MYFSLKQFADRYTRNDKTKAEKQIKRLWGEMYVDGEGKWSKKPGEGKIRGFNKLILDPIFKIFDFCMKKNDPAAAVAMAEKLIEAVVKDDAKMIEEMTLTKDDKEKEGKQLFKVIMKKWLPAGETLLQMITIHLPSPVTAQRYRASMLYEGPKDDAFCKGIEECDPNVSTLLWLLLIN